MSWTKSQRDVEPADIKLRLKGGEVVRGELGLKAVGLSTCTEYVGDSRRQLGHGSFGQVYAVKGDGLICLKDMRDRRTHGRTATRDLKALEEAMLTAYSHSDCVNTVSLLEMVSIGGSPYTGYVMEKGHATLEQVVHSHDRFPFQLREVKVLIHQLLTGVAHLHNLNIVHLSITPKDIQVNFREGVVKLACPDAIAQGSTIEAKQANLRKLLEHVVLEFAQPRRVMLSEQILAQQLRLSRSRFPNYTEPEVKLAEEILTDKVSRGQQSPHIVQLAAYIYEQAVMLEEASSNTRPTFERDMHLAIMLSRMRQLGPAEVCSASSLLDFLSSRCSGDMSLAEFFNESRRGLDECNWYCQYVPASSLPEDNCFVSYV